MDSLLAQSSFITDTGIFTEVKNNSGIITSFPGAKDNYPVQDQLISLFNDNIDGFIVVVNFPSVNIKGTISWSSSGKSASFSAKWGVSNGDIQYGSEEYTIIFSGTPSDNPNVSVNIPATSITLTPSIPNINVGLLCSANGNSERDYRSVASFNITPLTANITYKIVKIS